MTAATSARSTWPMVVEQAPSADRVAISSDWEMLGIFRASPTTGEPIKGALMCKVDADAGTVGQIRMRPVAGADGPSGPVTVSGPASGVRLGFLTLVAGTDQLVYLEGRRVSGTGGIRVLSAAGTVQSAPFPTLLDSATKFQTTEDLAFYFLGPNSQILAYMSNTPNGGVDSRQNVGWSQGQFSSFTNDDTSPSYGFWYPNTLGSPAYSNADYMIKASTPNAFSGDGYAQVIQKNPYNSSVACQLWRTLDQAGGTFPPELWISWRMKFHETITYDHVISGTDFGFTNHVQVYKTQPTGSRGPFITLGAGRDLVIDSAMRWHINLDNRASYDLTQVTTPTIPINQWIFMEMHVVISDGVTDSRTGRVEVWQDDTKILNYTGPTVADYWEQIGVSWGAYGHLMGQNPVTIDYDECLISTVAARPNLLLPATAGGYG